MVLSATESIHQYCADSVVACGSTIHKRKNDRRWGAAAKRSVKNAHHDSPEQGPDAVEASDADHFHRRDCIAQFHSILQNKCNLTTLCLHRCDFHGVGEEQLYGDIISIVSCSESSLRCFEFLSHRIFLEPSIAAIRLETLLGAVEKSKLERFHIGHLSWTEMRTLAQKIPSMKLKELIFRYCGVQRRNIEEELLHAVANNFTLRSVKGNQHERTFLDNSSLFDNGSNQRLAFYANRNERLDQWVDNPEPVDQKVWPEALGLAERAGPDALFRGLRSVLGRDYVSTGTERDRATLRHIN